MKLYNRSIYHCLSCGAVKTIDPDEDEPACCGKKMVHAAAETVVQEDLAQNEKARAPTEHKVRGDSATK